MSSESSGSSSGVVTGIVLFLLLVCLGLAAFFLVPRLAGAKASSATAALLHEVKNDDLLITVTEEGNVESAQNVEVKCQVAGGSSILWIVEDGKQVKKGEKIVELDSSALEDSINTQRIAYEKARATKLQSEKNFSVAQISVREYLEGTYKQLLQDAEALITIAEENLRASKNSLDHSEKMFRKGYVSELDLEGSRFAVERSELELGSAKTARDVLMKFTKEKTLEDLRSQRDNAEAQMRSDASAFELEETRLKRLEDQLRNCTILAPQDGMVVYANERGGRFGQTTASIEEGASIRERQTILRLPDLDQMQVKVNVHESKIDQMQPGMRARIRILNNEFTGQVTSVANQPEPTSFFTGNVKEYATNVRVTDTSGTSDTLRPGMTAEVEILVAHLKEVATLPVAAVVEKRGKYMAWVDAGGEPEKRPLVIGLSNDEFVHIKDGVAAGESVLLNPRAIVKEAQEIANDEGIDVNKRFGQATSRPAAGGPGGGRGGMGGPGARAGAGGQRAGGGMGGPGGRPGGEGGRPGGGPGAGGRPGGGGPGGGAGPGGGGGRRPGGGMSALDKDGDGKISKDEAPGGMKDRFDSLDGNGDGFIDKAEQAALMKRFQGAGGGRPGGGGGQ